MKEDTNILDLGFQKGPLWIKCQMDSSRARICAEKRKQMAGAEVCFSAHSRLLAMERVLCVLEAKGISRLLMSYT